jgi:hypothetical protein
MKITKKNLKRIIKEAMAPYSRNPEDTFFSDREAEIRLDDISHDGDMYGDNEEDRAWSEAEYSRGYQDGYDAAPPTGDASADYDIGYEDGNSDGNAESERDYEMGNR